jgi:hypothetical protein
MRTAVHHSYLNAVWDEERSNRHLVSTWREFRGWRWDVYSAFKAIERAKPPGRYGTPTR